MTTNEIIRRVAMRALLDAVPGMTHARLVALCHASYTTVHDAAIKDVAFWCKALENAPDPRAPSLATHQHTAPHWNRVPSRHTTSPAVQLPAPPRERPGDRRHARLVPPDAADQAIPADERTDVDIEPSNAGWRDDRHLVAADPLDDPKPRGHRKQEKKSGL